MKYFLKKLTFSRTLAFLLASLWLIVTFLPFFYMIINSFKDQRQLMKNGAFSLPDPLYLGNYETILKSSYPRYFINSVTIVFLSLICVLTIASMASYIFARIPTKMSNFLYSIVVACMSIPIHISYIPVFILTKKFGIYDSIWALLGPYVTFNLPISIFILTGFMKGLPKEMEAAAQIDGCSQFQTFLRIILPLCKPGLVTVGIYDIIHFWNEFSFALVLTQSKVNRTLPLAPWDYKAEYTANTPVILAVLTLSTLPMLIAFVFGQDKLVKGMMAGAVKG